MIDLNKLRHAVVLARTGNFNRAADELNLTQPALTRSIQALEEQHEIRLFERGRKGAALTPAGAVFVREAEELLQRADVLARTATQLSTGELGEIAFGMGPLPASLLLPNLLSEIAVSHRGLRVRADVQRAEILTQELQAGRIEFFCAAGPLVPTGGRFEVAPLATVPLALLVRKTHPLVGKSPLTVDDLRAYPLIGGAAPYASSSFSPSIACENFHVLKDVIARTDAIWYATPLLLDAKERRAFATLNAPGLAVNSVNLVLVGQAHRAWSPAAQIVLSRVRAIVAEMGIGP